MATYLVSDLISRLVEIYQDGYSLVEINELPADDESPACLSFNAVNTIERVDYEEIDSVELDISNPVIKRSIDAGSLCGSFLLTYTEIATVNHALNNAIEYFKEEIQKPDCPKDLKRELKSDCVDFRNLHAKIAQFFKRIGIPQK